MNRLFNWLGLILIVAAAVYFIRFATENIGTFLSVGWNQEQYKVLLYATALYCLAPLIGACAWLIFMLNMGEPATPHRIVRIFLLAQFAKYVPSNVMHYFGRLALARRYDIGVGRAAFTLVLETGLTILCAVVLASMAFLYTGKDSLAGRYSFDSIWQLGLLVLAGLCLLVASIRVLEHWRPALTSRLSGGESIPMPGTGVFVICFLLYVFNFVLMGYIVLLLLSGMYGVSTPPFLLITGIFALSWVAGIITPGAPAGIGVREAVLVALLQPLYGGVIVLGVTIALRIVTIIGDALVFTVALAYRRGGASKISSC